jgi:TRAP-type C4-dicarboxylate transport system permease small subunit
VQALARAYRQFLAALAWLAGAVLTVMLAAILYDVIARNLGAQPPEATLPIVEFGLLYITMLTAPWLVRTRGHIIVEALTSQLPAAVHYPLAKAVYAVCTAICIAFAWYAAELALGAWQRGEMDERALAVPSWTLYAPAIVSFALMAIEFARYLFGRDTLYTGRIGGQESSL